MKPALIKQSGLTILKPPMRPSILTRPAEKMNQQIKKVLQTFKAP